MQICGPCGESIVKRGREAKRDARGAGLRDFNRGAARARRDERTAGGEHAQDEEWTDRQAGHERETDEEDRDAG